MTSKTFEQQMLGADPAATFSLLDDLMMTAEFRQAMGCLVHAMSENLKERMMEEGWTPPMQVAA